MTNITPDQAQHVIWNPVDNMDPRIFEDAIKAGADVNAKEPETDRTPLIIMCEQITRGSELNQQVMKLLLDAGADPLGGDCALRRAISNESPWQVLTIVDHCLKHDLLGDDQENIFHVFAEMVRSTDIDILLRTAVVNAKTMGKINLVSQKDGDGNTPLQRL